MSFPMNFPCSGIDFSRLSHLMYQFSRAPLSPEQENEIKLTLPGMRSKVVGAPPPLERLESLVSSPCVSDSTLTTRRLREMIPCTPSPMYAYDMKFGESMYDAEGRLLPRFFPFPYHAIHAGSESFAQKSGEHESGPNVSPKSGSSSNRQPETPSPSFLISPNGGISGSPVDSLSVNTPIAENAEPVPPSSALLARIKQSVRPNGGLDISPDISLDKAVDEVLDLAKDQVGSRFLQQVLDTKLLSAARIERMFIRILPETKQLTVDPFGNYVVQKLIESLTPTSRSRLLEQLTGNVYQLAIHMYGCRVIQKLIETSDLEQQLCVARELKGHVLKCVEDQNGNHVIQKLIERIPSEHLGFIVAEFLGHLPVMAVHCYGCRVVQRLLETLRPAESAHLVDEILANLWQLSQDQYGNYVIQHVLLHGTSQNRSVIVQVIASHIIEFSCHKYASNIAEKALLCSEDQTSRDLLIGAVIGTGGPDAPLHVLMKDRFANYVIQRCIEFSHDEQRIVLVTILRANLPLLKRVIYGKHIANAIERIIALEASTTVPL